MLLPGKNAGSAGAHVRLIWKPKYLSLPPTKEKATFEKSQSRNEWLTAYLLKEHGNFPYYQKTVIRKMRYIAMQGTCQCHLVISFPAGITRNNWGPMEERPNSICVCLQQNLKNNFFRLCSPCPGNMKRPTPPGKYSALDWKFPFVRG